MILSISIVFVLLLPTCLSYEEDISIVCEYDRPAKSETRGIDFTVYNNYHCFLSPTCHTQVHRYEIEDYWNSSYKDVCCSDRKENICVAPFCSPPLCQTANCKESQECTCHNSYKPTSNKYLCVPKCSQQCEFGKCTKPERCTCNNGYELTSNKYVCAPKCSRQCEFGTCTAPETCTCDRGYTLSNESNISSCQPLCNDSCANGNCTAPDTCTCDPGFEYNSTTTDCHPVCAEPCVNGFCESPDSCQCLLGYNQSFANSSICEPVCENCAYGTCIAPDNCVCDEGFIMEETRNETCIPTCKPQCKHATCSVKGCECFYGWEGDNCDEPLFCVIVEPVRINIAEGNNHKEGDEEEEKNVVNFTKDHDNREENAVTQVNFMESFKTADYRTEWKGPFCHSQCLAQLDNVTVHSREYFENVTHHYISIDSRCNVPSLDYVKYIRWAGSAIGIVLLSLFICAIILSCRKRRVEYAIRIAAKSKRIKLEEYNSFKPIA